MEIIREFPELLRIKIVDLLNNTYALNVHASYERTWLSGEKDTIFVHHWRSKKYNGRELASYATHMEEPDFKLPKPKPARIKNRVPIYSNEDMEIVEEEIEESESDEELEEGEIAEEPEKGEVCCMDEYEFDYKTRGFGDAEDHSILLRMLKEGRMKFQGYRLHVDLHQIFYTEPECLGRMKKVIMYFIKFRLVKRIDFCLWGYVRGNYSSCVPQDLFVKHVSPMLKDLPTGDDDRIIIGYDNSCRPGYVTDTRYTEWVCQYTYDEEDTMDLSYIPEPSPEPFPEWDIAPDYHGWTPPHSPERERDPRFDGWGNHSWDFALGLLQ